MKKMALFMLVVFMAFTISGCSSAPEGLYPETHEYGLKAIDTIDQYLDGKISGTDAAAQLEDYAEVLEALNNKEPENDNDKNCWGNNMIVTPYIKSAAREIGVENSGLTQHPDSIIKSRDKIKEILESPTIL